ncbi:MAG: hypothetical protein U0175_21235 [Caldilineaceae bacterium]
MNYVKCINNEGYEGSLSEGKVYRVLSSEPSLSSGMIRIIDETHGEPGSEKGYLFAATRFEPVDLNKIFDDTDDSLTIHLPATLKGILYAEALVAQKSMSALAREWIEEHLDLAQAAD